MALKVLDVIIFEITERVMVLTHLIDIKLHCWWSLSTLLVQSAPAGRSIELTERKEELAYGFPLKIHRR